MNSFVAFFYSFIFLQHVNCFTKQYVTLIEEKLKILSNIDSIEISENAAEVLGNLPKFFKSNPGFWENTDEHISVGCKEDWQLIGNLTEEKPASISKFWDSYAVPGTGILAGHVLFPGQYQECVDTKRGYSAITVDFPDTGPYLNYFVLPGVTFVLGTCMPLSCTNEDVATIYGGISNEFRVESMGRESFKADAGFVIACIVFGSIAALIACGSLYSVAVTLKKNYNDSLTKYVYNDLNVQDDLSESRKDVENPEEEPFVVRFLMCFDFYTNFGKIMAVPKQSNPDQLPVLNGMRVMSLGWVMIGHLLLIQLYVMDNPLYAMQRCNNFLMQVIGNGTPSVDTFFIMSGLLVMLGTLRTLDKFGSRGKPGTFWPLFYVHRLIRLWPTMLLTILFTVGFYANLAPIFYSPTFQNSNSNSVPSSCKGTNWLSTAFFYSNLVSDPGATCIDWTWYVSNDMQFYLISPVFVLLYRIPGKGKLMSVCSISLLILVNTLIVLIASGVNNAPPAAGTATFGVPSALTHFDFTSIWATSRLYFACYCRFQTYGQGLLLGALVYERNWIQSKLDNLPVNKRVALIGSIWTVAFAMGFVSVFGCYPYDQGGNMGAWGAAFYNATFRLLWGFFVSALILLCTLGYGGVINDFLSLPFWIPFARVNYTTYIIHLMCLILYSQALEHVVHFSTLDVTLACGGILICINCLSLVVSCIIEAPFIAVEKLLLRR